MADSLSTLIRSGMPKRQAKALLEVAGGGAGGAENAIVARRPYVNSGEGLQLPWPNGGQPYPGDVWSVSAEVPLGMTVERVDGDAMSYDAETGEITYLQDGIYLSHFHAGLSMSPSVMTAAGFTRNDDAARTYAVEFIDWQYLDKYESFPNDDMRLGRFGANDTTWVSVQSAGDTNVLPYLYAFRGPNPVEVLGANFLTVRLQA